MSKLFAMEDIDKDPMGGELEATPEVGEVADVQTNVEDDAGDLGEATTAIDEGVGAVDQLEQVEEVVADAAEGEGLDPVAAEAVKLAVEAICARVGADPKKVFGMYASENFQSTSNRKQNTRIALEGVGDFLKDMWKKIKAALQRLMDKARSFWDNHISSLGRVKKALMSAKDRIGNSSGKLESKAYIEEAPGYLKDAFGFSKDISAATIKDVVKTHAGLTQTADQINNEIQFLNDAALRAVNADKADFEFLLKIGSKEHNYGTAQAPMVGGVYVHYQMDVDKGEGVVNLEIETEKVDRESKLGVQLVDKAGLQDVIKQTIYVIDDTIRYRDKTKKIDEATNKFFLALEKRIEALSTSSTPEDTKDLRNIMKVVYKINAKAPQLNADLVIFNVKLGKAVLGFAGLCMKNYK